MARVHGAEPFLSRSVWQSHRHTYPCWGGSNWDLTLSRPWLLILRDRILLPSMPRFQPIQRLVLLTFSRAAWVELALSLNKGTGTSQTGFHYFKSKEQREPNAYFIPCLVIDAAACPHHVWASHSLLAIRNRIPIQDLALANFKIQRLHQIDFLLLSSLSNSPPEEVSGDPKE
ncbi:hypothetical protein VNO77_42005 [Canavalia gladiata]|uniref:Uncharacterized protein n=1 Tax=Canavalia gladiata TaxID=3824 RepID=A0AAN9K1Z2_CANGL